MGHRVERAPQMHGRHLLVVVALCIGGVAAQANLPLVILPCPPPLTFTVNSNGDATDASPGDCVCETATGNGVCTLRAAIQEANFNGQGTINLPAGTYTLAIPGRGESEGATGDLNIIGDLTIVGAGASTTIINGGGVDRVFDNSALTSISNVTIRGGDAGMGATYGGGIQNTGLLTLTDVTVTSNVAGSGGGGIYNIFTATLMNVTVNGNSAGLIGGGINNDGTVTLTNVTLSGNQAGTGGGGIENSATVTLTNVTLSNDTGGGIDNMGGATLKNTIVASNNPANCAGAVDSSGNNLDSANTCAFTGSGDLHDVNPMLGPLQDNGGPTFTRALMPGSPAIDAGSGDCPPPATDQRGVTRPVDGNGDGTAVCDIGAFEFEPAATTTTTVAGGSTSSTSVTTTTLPGCSVEATLPSIDCRVGELMDEVQASVPAGTVHDALVNQLTKAMMRTAQAMQAEGNVKREKKALAKAAKALKKFQGRLRTKKAQKVIPDEVVRMMLQTAAGQVRTSILTLRGML